MPNTWRRRAAAVVAGLALAVPAGLVASTPAQAHGCSHSSHYVQLSNGAIRHDHWGGHHYYSGGYYHHWNRWHHHSDGHHLHAVIHDCWHR